VATCTMRVSSNLSGVQWVGAEALKLSEVLGECAQDVIAVPLPKTKRTIHASFCLLVLVLGFSHTKDYNNTSEESVQLGCVLN
jgi:hypothetical protein